MADVLDQVTTIVRILCAYRGITPAELGLEIGMSRQTMSNKMRCHTRFTLEEVVAMADALDVDAKVWFAEPDQALDYLKPRPKKDGDFRTGSSQYTVGDQDVTLGSDQDQMAVAELKVLETNAA
jgi:transcriptional regulator with XRE-family HTH domain